MKNNKIRKDRWKFLPYEEAEKIVQQAVREGRMIPSQIGYRKFVRENPDLKLPIFPDILY